MSGRKVPARSREKGSTLITDALLRQWRLPKLDGKLGKEERGRVLVVGGSQTNPGAVILAAIGSLRAGAGKLQIATSASVAAAVATTVPEARVLGLRQTAKGELAPGSCRAIREEMVRSNALLVGPGMIDPRAGIELLRHCVRTPSRGALIVDAAALRAFEGRRPLPHAYAAGIVLTPHAGEMAKLWAVERDQILADPLSIARRAAAKLGAVVALKGARTYIAAPDGTAFHCVAGNVGLGTSGSGDTLAGVIAGLCARGADPLQAAAWGVYLHAKAGDVLARKIGLVGFLARELLAEIPRLLDKLTP